MIKLLSIHIPKTAGTSFYHVLQQVYPTGLSPSLRRKDIISNNENEKNNISYLQQFDVIHGHITYEEAAPFCTPGETKVICWLRHPVDRVISNYHFFMDRLEHAEINPEVAKQNRHRINETLVEYAEKEENRNRMSKFITGLSLDDFFFVGLMEFFEEDLAYLAKSLQWPSFELPRLNKGNNPNQLEPDKRELLAELNKLDMTLYHEILASHTSRHKCTQSP